MPAVFLSDFGPMPAVLNDDYAAALGRLGRELPRPKAVLVMSGHWEADGTLRATGARRPETIYDFHGFPEEFYRVRFPAPGSPETAEAAVRLLREAGFEAEVDAERGLDHGAWAPLSRVFPNADVPVVQLTVPARWEPEKVLSAGRALAPLRERGVLIVASGNLIHNLRLLRFGDAEVDPWAERFDRWLGEKLDAGDVAALARYGEQPDARKAAPTPEHFVPLFWVLGAAEGARPAHRFDAIRHGNGLLRIFTLDDKEASR